MVLRDDSDFWIDNLSSAGYVAFNKTSSFVQFKAPQIAAWPIDLMLVDANTFTKTLADTSPEKYTFHNF